MPHTDNGNRSRGIKKSKFVAGQTVPSGATFDFVSSNTNTKITFEDLKTSLGVTGTLTQAGAVTGTPVLDIAGTTFKVRNLEDGSGILTSLSPENGITIEHNFTFDTIGAPLSSNPTVASPVFKSLISGTGIDIVQGVSTITLNATGLSTATNTIVINQESDFPDQDASTITLTGGIIYILGASFSTAKRFIVNAATEGMVMTAGNQFGEILTYTGTGDMFTIVDCSFISHDITFDSPNANQTFNHSDTVPGTSFHQARSMQVKNTPKWGTFTNLLLTQFLNSNSTNADDGITIAGTGQIIFAIKEFSLLTFTGGSAFTYVDLGSSVIPNLEFDNAIATSFGAAGTRGIVGLANGGNLPAGAIATVTLGNFNTITTPLVGIDPDDDAWFFSGNATIRETIRDSLLSMQGNATETVISSIGVGVKVAGTFVIGRQSGFTGDTTGRSTYNLSKGIVIPMTVTLTALMASGGVTAITACIAINGVVDTNSCISATASASVNGAITLAWQEELVSGDFIEVFIQNDDNTTNIIVDSMVQRVN